MVFLNHGSFGACPRPVFEVYQNWQLELERQPVEFLGRRHDALLDEARQRLAAYLNGVCDNLVYLPNATAGVNLVARSLPFEPGDEILTTDHEYGAMDFTWQFVAQQTGARYVRHHIPVPVGDPAEFVESFLSAVTPRTKVIFLSQMTSSTSLIFPIEPICRRARELGIVTVIDGAHAPGHIPVDLAALDVDFYAGNCHKWLCAPKGSGFLYARAEHHRILNPLIVSWGWSNEASFVQKNQGQGTRDISAFLSVPAAIDFLAEHHWEQVRADCHALARATRVALSDLFDVEPLQPDSPQWFNQMVAVPLPQCDPDALKRRLWDEYKVEIPMTLCGDRWFIRASFQGYNTRDDLTALVNGLKTILYG